MAAEVLHPLRGMRLANVETARLQTRDLKLGLELGNRSLDIRARVQSSQGLYPRFQPRPRSLAANPPCASSCSQSGRNPESPAEFWAVTGCGSRRLSRSWTVHS